MADKSEQRDLPKAPKSKKSRSKQPKQSSQNHDESTLITGSNDTPEPIIRKKRPSTPQLETAVTTKEQTKLSPRRKRPKTPDRKRQNLDGIENPNFNANNFLEDSQQTSKKRRRSQKPDGTTDRSDYASNYSLRSGKSIPPSLAGSRSGSGIANSGDASMSETNINGSTSKIRKKRRRKPAVNVSSTKIESLGVDLADIEDDIVDEGTDAEADNTHQVTHKNHMKSQPIGKLFIEQTRRFKSIAAKYIAPKNVTNQPAPIDMLYQHLYFTGNGGFKSTGSRAMEELYTEDQRNKQNNEDEEGAYPVQISAIAFALTSIKVYRTFTHFCMGILAGLTIWQALYAYSFTNIAENDIFLEIYQYMSVPINCTFYILIVVCTVAAFDKYDISKVTRPCLLKACTLQSGAVAAILHVAALCVNVSLAPMDDRLGPKTNGTFDLQRDFETEAEKNRHLATWRVLAIVRAVLLVVAWFIVALCPTTDRLSKNIGKTENIWGENVER